MDRAFPFIQGKQVKAATICLLWLLTQQARASSLSRSCDLSIKAPCGGGRGQPWLGGRGHLFSSLRHWFAVLVYACVLIVQSVKCLPLFSLKLSRDAFGEGNGTPLQFPCLENPMDGGAWWAAVHGIAKSQT